MITSFFKPKRDRASAAGKENDGKEVSGQNKKQKKEPPKAAKKIVQDSPEAKALISYLNDTSSTDSSTPTWQSALDKHFSSSSFKRLASFVDKERYVFFCKVYVCWIRFT